MSIREKFAEILAGDVKRPPLAAVWYKDPGTPDAGTWWWAVEHQGHPAFYLRALLAGDFAPGRAPAPRHAATLDGDQYREGIIVTCGSCGLAPETVDLEPVERATGDHGFLTTFRDGRAPWPRPTDPASCWLCGDRKQKTQPAKTPGGPARTCARCASHLAIHSRRRD